MNDKPFISVIIPVFNDADRLGRCLAALDRQTYPTDRYEIIVVDNGSVPPLTPVPLANATLHVLREERCGSYAARNLGLARARGTILAFTDADCLPADDWLEKGAARLAAIGSPGIVAGHIELIFKDPQHPSVAELYDRLTGLRQDLYVSRGWGATANLFVDLAIFDAVGPFDASLKSGGDYQWGKRATDAGFPIVLGREVVVSHPARGSIQELRAKRLRITGGQFDRTRVKTFALVRLLGRSVLELCGVKHLLRALFCSAPGGLIMRFRVMLLMKSLQLEAAVERMRLYRGGMSRRA